MRLLHALLLLAVFATHAARAQDPLPQPAPAFATRGAFIAMEVPDLEASARWYREVLGLRETHHVDVSGFAGMGVVVLEGGGLTVELLEHFGSTPRPPEPAHLHGPFKAGVVVSDFEATVATLRARGADIAYGPYPASESQR